MQDEVTDVSLKRPLWFLKLKCATQLQIQQSLVLHRKVLKEGTSNIERNLIPQPTFESHQVCKKIGLELDCEVFAIHQIVFFIKKLFNYKLQ